VFTFGNPYAVTCGTMYAVILRHPSSIGAERGEDDGQTGARIVTYNGSAWSTDGAATKSIYMDIKFALDAGDYISITDNPVDIQGADKAYIATRIDSPALDIDFGLDNGNQGLDGG